MDVLSKIGFRPIRRTFITAMAERNLPLPVTMEMASHMYANSQSLGAVAASYATLDATFDDGTNFLV